ncbi:uncharacterized protein LOC106719924 [Papilio machaon]|uniref:uncharacterized protein LOC106719924 n=1 Tax=Papilio machaon TaxID=76193 RepID=UPI001E66338D|nr:uncharacterized protein LOC106719924 [Papilio machaon]
MAQKDDSLFLLEVLIDKIVLSKVPCFTDKDFRTCVSIECPSVETLEICDDETGTNVARSDGPFVKTFNSGKSCLFSLKEDQISKAMSKFPINVSVFQSLPCGCLPSKVVLGECVIDMTKEFVESRNKYLEDPSNVSYQALKDSFKIVSKDQVEAGEIIMFLRISCFGKLIVTKFQGTGASNAKSSGASASVDRSCLPQREYQSAQDPCVCGSKRYLGGGSGPSCTVSGAATGGVCPPARDPFNSMPCEEPDDPCFCSGPKSPTKQKMICRNTDQYCLHVPKGTSLHEPFGEENIGIDNRNLQSEIELAVLNLFKNNMKMDQQSEDTSNSESYQWLTNTSNTEEVKKSNTGTADLFSNSSICTVSAIRSKNRSVSFAKTIDYFWNSQNQAIRLTAKKSNTLNETENVLFGKTETTVYMTLLEDYTRQQSTGTQATGSINKCLQFNSNKIIPTITCANNNGKRSSTNLLYLNNRNAIPSHIRNQSIYFFGKKKDGVKLNKGMGSQDSVKRSQHKCTPTAVSTQACASKSCVSMQTNKIKENNSATGPKSVTIKTNSLKPCPALGTVKGDMMATVSHIKIAPTQPCPVHGKDPCQGPSCIAASTQEEQGTVKVSTVSNPRRGVFELVIRKMTGAPLARNELMLEWTPPPCRTPSCAVPGSCLGPQNKPSSCRQSKYKIITCRPSSCRPKHTNKIYKRPCSPTPVPICPGLPCKRCCRTSCCGKSCRSTPTCLPVITCSPDPSPCVSPCPPSPLSKNPCRSPCSSPCLRPCPVGRKRPKRARSHPRIKAHPKRISPCLNKTKVCPVLRCKSIFMPCVRCCNVVACYPRRICSLTPCKPLMTCRSDCSIKCRD